ncbi:unnamed protein product [Adineta ricciae]|uniref:G-protein coupled receptors family 1 profile domain-containing protein n=1 Tax=Adineta ricciae TaxID=249248 RepID=A0A814IWL8_ADIRI|nr:unnamed protein product [Adineta ricciae]
MSSNTVDILNTIRDNLQYFYYVIFLYGTIGNFLNTMIFSRLKPFHGNRCAFYFTMEAIGGIVFLFLGLINSIARQIHGSDLVDSVLIWCRIRFITMHGMALILFFTICCAACDQFWSTHYRFGVRYQYPLKLARYIMLISSCIWLSHSIVFALFLNIQSSSSGCVITNFILIWYSTYCFYPILYGPLQIFLAFVFSLLAYRNVRHIIRQQISIERRQLDQQMTAMVLIRVIFCLILGLPYTCFRIYIINHPFTRSNLLRYTIGQILQIIVSLLFSANFASNFYIFFATSAQFRRQVKYFFRQKTNRVRPFNVITATSNQNYIDVS